MQAETFNGTNVRPSPAIQKAYRGTHCGVKQGKNLVPKEPARPNKKAQDKLARRVKQFETKGQTKHLHTRPGSLQK